MAAVSVASSTVLVHRSADGRTCSFPVLSCKRFRDNEVRLRLPAVACGCLRWPATWPLCLTLHRTAGSDGRLVADQPATQADQAWGPRGASRSAPRCSEAVDRTAGKPARGRQNARAERQATAPAGTPYQSPMVRPRLLGRNSGGPLCGRSGPLLQLPECLQMKCINLWRRHHSPTIRPR